MFYKETTSLQIYRWFFLMEYILDKALNYRGWFLTCFDSFHEIGNKYLFSYPLTQWETELSNTAILIFFKYLFTVRQELHDTVCYVDQVDEHFNPFAVPDHVATQRPECLLFIVTDLYIPYADILLMSTLFWNLLFTVDCNLNYRHYFFI